MKATLSLSNTDHDFQKTNLITLKGGYDTYACKCGLHGKRYGLSDNLQVNGKAALILNCPNPKPKEPVMAKRVRITNFTGFSTEFENLTRGTEHDVVECPKEYKNKYANDIWVMGVKEPVRLLLHEYEEI